MQESQTLAFWAGSHGGVERKHIGSWLTIGNTRDGTHQTPTEITYLLALGIKHEEQTVALVKAFGHRLVQTFRILILHTQLVNDHLNVMHLVAVQFHATLYHVHLAVYTDIDITFAQNRLENLAVMSLSSLNKRSQKKNAPLGIVRKYHLHNLLFCILYHALPTFIGIGGCSTGIKKSEEIIHFGHGSHRRTRILVGSLLFYGDYRRQSGYLVNVRTFKIAKEVTGIGRKSLDVSPLSFCIERIKSQTGLAASGKTGNDRKTTARNADINILEVMDTGTHNLYSSIFSFFCHCHSITIKMHGFIG